MLMGAFVLSFTQTTASQVAFRGFCDLSVSGEFIGSVTFFIDAVGLGVSVSISRRPKTGFPQNRLWFSSEDRFGFRFKSETRDQVFEDAGRTSAEKVSLRQTNNVHQEGQMII